MSELLVGARRATLTHQTRLCAVAVATAFAVSLASSPASSQESPIRIFVSPSGLDTNPGTEERPVLTLNRAYRIARPGQVVEVGGGTYPYQRIDRDPSKDGSARRVRFQSVVGSATFPGLDLGYEPLGIPGPRRVTLRRLAVGFIRAWAGSDDFRLGEDRRPAVRRLRSTNLTGSSAVTTAPARLRLRVACLSFAGTASKSPSTARTSTTSHRAVLRRTTSTGCLSAVGGT